MPESTTTRKPAAKTATTATSAKPAAARKARSAKPAAQPTAASARTAAPRRAPSPAGPASVVDRTTHLSDEVLEAVEAGQLSAIDAVRTFVDTVDRALPGRGDAPSRRHEVVGSALEMAEPSEKS